MKRILHISPNFNYSCGVSKLVYLTLKYFNEEKNYEIHFITNGGDSLDRVEELKNVNFNLLKFTRGIRNIFFTKKFNNDVKNYCIEKKINIIHTYHRYPEYVAAKVSNELKIKSVGTVLSFVRGFKKISFQSDKLITVSNAITKHLITEFNVKANKITTMYLPQEDVIENQSSQLYRDLGISKDIRVLLFTGRISIIKNVDNLLKAYEIVYKRFENVILILCGSIESKKIGSMIKKLAAPVILLEPRRDNQILYSVADIILLPSRIDPFPFVMIEAGSYKKPFIGGNTGGIAEFIEDGINGLLIDPEDSEQLAEKIIYLLNNTEFALSLGEKLYDKVKMNCGQSLYFSKLDSIYNSLYEQ
jgi:glycosyltransferase involved in cell wall biosynthesis